MTGTSEAIGAGSGTVMVEGQRFENAVVLEKVNKAALRRLQVAARADAKLAGYKGIGHALKKYLAGTGCVELYSWANLAHKAQISRGMARFKLLEGYMFQIPLEAGDQVIKVTPTQRWGSAYFPEKRFPIDNPSGVTAYGVRLGYPLVASNPAELTLARLRVAELGFQDGSYVELGIDSKNFEQREGVEIIPKPPQEIISQAGGELAIWLASRSSPGSSLPSQK